MSVCVDLRKEQARLQKTLDELLKKLAADTARHDTVQMDDDEAGIEIAESELASIEESLLDNACYSTSNDLPQPPATLAVWIIPATLRPNEPFTVGWRFGYSDTETRFDIGNTVSVDIYLNQFGTRTHLWGEKDIKFPPDATPPTNTISGYVPVAATPDEASIIYKIGANAQIIVRVDGNGPAAPYEVSTDIFVKKWDVDPSWWSWTVPDLQYKEWTNDIYILAGNLQNGTPARMQDAAITLMEIASAPDPTPTPVNSVNAGAMEPHASSVAAFPALKKDWKWISGEPFFVVHAHDTSRTFRYYVTFAFTQDEYGNPYGDKVRSSSVLVIVTVAFWKQASGTLAMQSAIGAAALFAAAVAALLSIFDAAAAPALFEASIAVYGAAELAYRAALDPPVPDPEYRRPVEIPLPPVDVGVSGDLPKTRRFVTALRYIVDLENTLLRVPGRAMAAQYFNDAPWTALHEQVYANILEQMYRNVAQLKSLAPAVESELATRTPMTGQLFAEIAARARDSWFSLPINDLPNERQNAFRTLLTDGNTMSRLATSGFAGVVGSVVQAAVDVAVSIPKKPL